jgi:hypothetical protein
MESFNTKDLGLGAFILAKGCNITNIRRDGKVCYFYFEDKDYCEELKDDYLKNRGYIDAFTYFESMKSLKSRIFNDHFK